MALSRLLEAAPALRLRPVVVHMDINRTIIHVDPAGGKSFEDVLNSNAARMVVGITRRLGGGGPATAAAAAGEGDAAATLDASSATAGTADGPRLAFEPLGLLPDLPRDATLARAAAQAARDGHTVMTYDDFVEEAIGNPPNLAALGSNAARREAMKGVSNQRRALRHSFTYPGQPGAPWAALVEQQRVALTRPPKNNNTNSSSSSGEAANTPERWHITPSFFAFVNDLSLLDWPFTLIFRTFGSDLPEVLAEWTTFVRGAHDIPAKGPILAKMAADAGDHAVPVGAIYRDRQGLSFCWGATAAPPPPAPSHEHLLGRDYLATLPSHCNARNVSYGELYAELTQAAHGAVVGAVDYYPYWSQHGEHRSAGKVFPVLRRSSTAAAASSTTAAAVLQSLLTTPDDDDPSMLPLEQFTASSSQRAEQAAHSEQFAALQALPPFQVFFDDNIRTDGGPKSIVDVRDATTGLPGTIQDEGVYCCQVEPFDAITDLAYFSKELATRMAVQAGITLPPSSL